MGTGKKTAQGKRSGKEAISSFELSSGVPESVHDVAGPVQAESSVQGPAVAQDVAPAATVDGVVVNELHCLLKQSPHGPGWLILPSVGHKTGGTYEFGRVYFSDGIFTLGPDRPNRIGPEAICSVDYRTDGRGLLIKFESGRTCQVPGSAVQSVTWA